MGYDRDAAIRAQTIKQLGPPTTGLSDVEELVAALDAAFMAVDRARTLLRGMKR